MSTPSSRFYEALRRLEHECYLADRGGCEGRLQAHHIYPKRILKAIANRLGVPASILEADARNGVLLCKRHHEKVEQGHEVFDRSDCPVRLSGFECQFPLVTSYWPRIYVRRRDHSKRRGRATHTSGHG